MDGTLEVSTGHTYIPAGKSVWEFSTSAEITKKANNDLRKRKNKATKDTVFIFVSSRNWNQKKEWLDDNSDSAWGKVLAYDANDLEQWLELSPCTSLWLSEKMDIPKNHLETPERFLSEWLSATDPPLPDNILLSNRDMQKEHLRAFFKEMRPGATFSVVADTSAEAVAFVSAVLKMTDPADCRAIIVKDQSGVDEATKWGGISSNPSILIAQQEVAKSLSTEIFEANVLVRTGVRGDFMNTKEANIGWDKFATLARVKNFDLIYNKDHITSQTHYRRAGGSLSILHRILNKNIAKKEPQWIKAADKDKKMIWLALIGRWDEQCDGDKEYIRNLAKLDEYQDWGEFARNLTNEEGAPLERKGDGAYRLFDRLDTFYAIAEKIDGYHIDSFLNSAVSVLTEEDYNHDPCLETAFNKPEIRHSSAMRSGIIEGITILNLSTQILEHEDISNKILEFYDGVFASDKAWYSLCDVLPQLAEASPYDFIRKLDNALDSKTKEIRILFDNHQFDNHKYSHLMWALELLAWNPDWFKSILQLLCKLQNMFEEEIENYGNKPSASMHNIMRSWMPQTAATIEQREEALNSLYNEYPWEIVQLTLALADEGDTVGQYTCMPIWREDALKVSQPTGEERIRIIKESIKIIVKFIADGEHDIEHRAQAAEKAMHNFRFWDSDSATKFSKAVRSIPKDHAAIAGNLRKYARSLLAWILHQKDDDYEIPAQFLREIIEHFRPEDIIEEKAFLFSAGLEMEELSADDLSGEKADDMRSEALKLIYSEQNIRGIIRLVSVVEQPDMVARSLYRDYIASNNFPLEEYLIELLESDIDIHEIRYHLSDIFGWSKENPAAMSAVETIDIVNNVISYFDKNDQVADWEEKKTFLRHAARIDEKEGRDYVDGLPEEEQKKYFSHHRIERRMECWKDKDSLEYPPENEWLAKKYIKYKRPRLGWNVFTFTTHIPLEWQLELLDAMYVMDKDDGKDRDPAPKSYDVQKFFDAAAKKPLALDQEKHLATIELRLYRIIDTYQIDRVSFVERHMGNSPEFFMDMVCYIYKTDDGKQELPKSENDQETAQAKARIIFEILFRLNLLSKNYPWIQDNKKLNEPLLEKWVRDVRTLAEKYNRSRVTARTIGTGLSHVLAGRKEVLPEPAICDILEDMQSDTVSSSFYIGRYNSRGMLRRNGVDEMGYTSSQLAEEYEKASIKMRNKNCLFVADLMWELAKSYRHDAKRHKDEEERMDLD